MRRFEPRSTSLKYRKLVKEPPDKVEISLPCRYRYSKYCRPRNEPLVMLVSWLLPRLRVITDAKPEKVLLGRSVSLFAARLID